MKCKVALNLFHLKQTFQDGYNEYLDVVVNNFLIITKNNAKSDEG